MAAAHPHAPYPAFDLDCIRDIIAIVRAGEVRPRLAEFVKCVYILTGAALSVTVGEPEGVEPLVGAPKADDELLEEAKAALAEAEEGLHGFGAAADDAEAIDPATLMLIIQLATKLIEAWLSKRRQ